MVLGKVHLAAQLVACARSPRACIRPRSHACSFTRAPVGLPSQRGRPAHELHRPAKIVLNVMEVHNQAALQDFHFSEEHLSWRG
jgi:hypothetical protein